MRALISFGSNSSEKRIQTSENGRILLDRPPNETVRYLKKEILPGIKIGMVGS